MKKWRMLASVWIAALLLGACVRSGSNGLMQDAASEARTLALYVYDGETVSRSFIYDSEVTQAILKELDQTQAKEVAAWSPEDITVPVYGLETFSSEGEEIYAAWTNERWIAQDGTVYSFDFDFEKLEQEYPWQDRDEYPSLSVFPCARLLTQDETGWNSRMLTAAAALNPPEGIAMTLVDQAEEMITVELANHSGDEWSYGEYYNLQVQLDDRWYEIPPVAGMWAFNDIAHELFDGGTYEVSYDLTIYGDLPAGRYRLIAYDLAVEFMK